MGSSPTPELTYTAILAGGSARHFYGDRDHNNHSPTWRYCAPEKGTLRWLSDWWPQTSSKFNWEEIENSTETMKSRHLRNYQKLMILDSLTPLKAILSEILAFKLRKGMEEQLMNYIWNGDFSYFCVIKGCLTASNIKSARDNKQVIFSLKMTYWCPNNLVAYKMPLSYYFLYQ